jgi:poly-beta-1,6-N-acetyl-D-glucosamine synthase
MLNDAYVIITAAHNEEQYIENTINSVVSQDIQPFKWIIASDASTDRTEEIVQKYATVHTFIELLRLDGSHQGNFSSKVEAIRTAYARLAGEQFQFIGILDADISMGPTYFGELLNIFQRDSHLGLAGGSIYEEKRGAFRNRRGNRVRSVAGAVQMFRRECYEAIGGLRSLRYGGEDWCAEVCAQMHGWSIRTIPKLKVFHHRPTGAANNLVFRWFQQGRMDFSLGSLPIFEIVKCFARFAAKPIVLGGLARLAGFVWSYCIGQDRLVSEEFVRCLRAEQRRRLIPALRTGRR